MSHPHFNPKSNASHLGLRLFARVGSALAIISMGFHASVGATAPISGNSDTSAKTVNEVQNVQVAILADLLRSDGHVVRMGGRIVVPTSGSIALALDNQGVIQTTVRYAQLVQLAQSGGLMVTERGSVVLTVQGREQLVDFCCINTSGTRPANVASASNGVFTLSHDPLSAQKPMQEERLANWTAQAPAKR